jgi:hypothetical protein
VHTTLARYKVRKPGSRCPWPESRVGIDAEGRDCASLSMPRHRLHPRMETREVRAPF